VLYDLYSSPNIIPVIKSQRIRWAEYVACMGARIGAYRVLVVRPEGKRLLRRQAWREDNIKMGLQEAGWGVKY
jgi:hypothetical protein